MFESSSHGTPSTLRRETLTALVIILVGLMGAACTVLNPRDLMKSDFCRVVRHFPVSR